MTGLVLTGGGARAAYQVGALQAIAELVGTRACPFPIVTGVSAGAINGVALAQGADDFIGAVDTLAATWRALTPERVYRTDLPNLLAIGLRWIKDLSSGGWFGPSRSNHLLDTAPLRALLCGWLSPTRLTGQLSKGLRCVAVTTTDYHTGNAVTFYQSAAEIAPWVRRNRLGRAARLSIDHVMASAAIPIFFPPVAMGGAFFGDGCVGLTAPLSPAIHLGAQRVLAIGVRYGRPADELVALSTAPRPSCLSLSEIAGVLLNAVFLDSLDADVERMERINATLSMMTAEQRRRVPLRRIPVLALRPSRDLGRLAAHQYERLPRTLRHLLRGIGATGERGWDLLSYLAFEPVYVTTLMSLGYADTMARRSALARFLARPALTA